MIILSIDPASKKNLGFSIGDFSNGEYRIFKSGTKILDENLKFSDAFNFINNCIEEHQINRIIYEQTQWGVPFVQSQISEIIGVIKLASELNKIEIIPLAPTTVKKTITDNGRANKKEMKNKIEELFPELKNIKSEHEIDAIAIGVAYTALERK